MSPWSQSLSPWSWSHFFVLPPPKKKFFIAPCFYYLIIWTSIYPYKTTITFTNILFTPHKDMTHHSTIPNSATYIYLHTSTHRNIPTVASLFFSLPLTTPQNGSWWHWQYDGTARQAVKINTHPTTAQHTNVLPIKLVISESQFTLLMEVCFDPIINFSMIYATIWYFLSVNSQLIFIPSLPMD